MLDSKKNFKQNVASREDIELETSWVLVLFSPLWANLTSVSSGAI